MWRNPKAALSLVMAGTLVLLSAPAMAWDWSFGNWVSGSGRISKVQRSVTGFKGVRLDLPGQVEIIQGDSESVVIETDDNLAPLVETMIEGDQLMIRSTQRHKTLRPSSLRITVHARTVEQLSVSGSGKLMAERLQSPKLQALISGSGDIRINALNADTLTVSIAGSGDFIAAGKADSVQSSIAGSGDLNIDTLAAKNVELRIAGSGDAKVWASQTLAIKISGSGNVAYYGDASVTQTVAGSGRIKKLGAVPTPGS